MSPAPVTPRRRPALRLRLGFLVIAMVMSVFAVRLFQLQGIDAQAYVARAAAEGVVTVELPASRGTIRDRTGVPLARSVEGMMLVADPSLTAPKAHEIATVIARRLSADYVELLERLRRPDTRFQYLVRRVPAAEARGVLAELDRRGLDGVDVRRDPVRTYPAGDVAANLLGFLNDLGDGAEGAELLFDPMLRGVDGSETYEHAGGNRLPLGESSVVPPQSGRDLTLTIDRDVQWYAQRVLRSTVQDARGDSGVAVVLDSRSGEVLAQADYPTFDARTPFASPPRLFTSAALRDVYEPGSVQKVLTAAALVDAGKVGPDTRITVPAELPRADRVINDYFDHGRLRLTFTGVIAKSSNIGTVLAADTLPARDYHRYLTGFGLGSRTGVLGGSTSESPGVLRHWRDWLPINKDTISFGQGVAVNAVQMAAAVNAIANGGVYVQPSLVKGRATTSAGDVVGADVAVRRRVVSERAARQTTRMMEAVTHPEEGTAPAAAIPGYRVAGKTGTAQRVGDRCGCYDGTFTVSFAGFAPADDPRFLVYVVVHNPRNGGGGGSVAAPAFRKIMTHLLARYAVPPTGATAPDPRVEW